MNRWVIFYNRWVIFIILLGNLLVAILARMIEKELVYCLFSGCDQMTCARFKEVSHLRIFRPKGLFVTFEGWFWILVF